ncbi:MAG: hypothetical protein IJ774_02265 [Selenomonadaceae bacterium]|nr:hypothetical protein [Selenomonadaceae bacterium]
MSNSVDTMKNFFNVLKLYANDTTTDGVAILDHAVKTTTHFASLQDAVNHFVYDIASVTAATGNPWQSLYQNCGIALGADFDFSVDTGSASGYNAGMGVVKNAQDIVPENGLLTDFSAPAAGSTTYHTYTGADGNTFNFAITYPSSFLEVIDASTAPYDPIIDFENPAYAQTTYLQAGQIYSMASGSRSQNGEDIAPSIITMATGIENFWIEQGLKLAYDTFGLDFDGKTLSVAFSVNSPFGADTEVAPDNAELNYLPANHILVILDSVITTPIDAANPNGSTYVAGGRDTTYIDRILAHELIHATMMTSGTLKRGMPGFFTEGVAELVHGLDDYDGASAKTLLDLATDSNRLAAAVPFKQGTGTVDSYPAGYAFLRYLIHESLPTNVVIGTGSTPETFSYAGGEEILSGVASTSQINTADNARIVTAFASGNDMIVATTAGNLIVRDVRGKIVNFANSAGNVYGHSYMSPTAGTVDGRGLSGYEFIAGADNADNTLIAGDNGAELWGGSYGNDELFGGGGADNFVAGVGCGNDTIYNAASNDRITLSATLDQITGANITSSAVTLNFSDGSTLAVAGTVGATFALSDGSTFVADQSTGQFIRTN